MQQLNRVFFQALIEGIVSLKRPKIIFFSLLHKKTIVKTLKSGRDKSKIEVKKIASKPFKMKCENTLKK